MGKRKSKEITLAILGDEKGTPQFWQYFEQNKKVKVIPVYLTVDAFMAQVDSHRYNSSFDVIYCPSVLTLKELKKRLSLQRVLDLKNGNYEDGSDASKSWFVLGYDPYVLQKSDHIKTYSDLKNGVSWTFNGSVEQKNYFFRFAAMHFNDTSKFRVWETAMLAHQLEVAPTLLDSNRQVANKHLSVFSKVNQEVIFPNQEGAGMFYDFSSLGIFPHTRNYEAAKSFMDWMLHPKNIVSVTNRLHLIPANYADIHLYKQVLFHRASPEMLLRNL